ncbi:unnamed protein product [Arctogadus glacialis]
MLRRELVDLRYYSMFVEYCLAMLPDDNKPPQPSATHRPLARGGQHKQHSHPTLLVDRWMVHEANEMNHSVDGERNSQEEQQTATSEDIIHRAFCTWIAVSRGFDRIDSSHRDVSDDTFLKQICTLCNFYVVTE